MVDPFPRALVSQRSRLAEPPVGRAAQAARGGHLTLTQGSAVVTLWSETTLPDLYRATFDGISPEVHVERGATISRPRRSPRAWLRRVVLRRSAPTGTITLTGAVPWRIAVQGRVARLAADIRALAIRSLLVDGRAREIELQLPRPEEPVPIRIGRATRHLSIHRPAGVPVRLALGGSVRALTIDGEVYGALPGDTRLISADDQQAPGRYDIAIAGGAGSITIDSGGDDRVISWDPVEPFVPLDFHHSLGLPCTALECPSDPVSELPITVTTQ